MSSFVPGINANGRFGKRAIRDILSRWQSGVLRFAFNVAKRVQSSGGVLWSRSVMRFYYEDYGLVSVMICLKWYIPCYPSWRICVSYLLTLCNSCILTVLRVYKDCKLFLAWLMCCQRLWSMATGWPEWSIVFIFVQQSGGVDHDAPLSQRSCVSCHPSCETVKLQGDHCSRKCVKLTRTNSRRIQNQHFAIENANRERKRNKNERKMMKFRRPSSAPGRLRGRSNERNRKALRKRDFTSAKLCYLFIHLEMLSARNSTRPWMI